MFRQVVLKNYSAETMYFVRNTNVSELRNTSFLAEKLTFWQERIILNCIVSQWSKFLSLYFGILVSFWIIIRHLPKWGRNLR